MRITSKPGTVTRRFSKGKEHNQSSNRLSSHFRHLFPKHRNPIPLIVFIIGFAGVGAYFLVKSQAAEAVYTVPSAIVADCSTEVSQQLNGWLNSIPDGTAENPVIVKFGAKACYNILYILDINNRSHWTLDGNGATLKRFDLSPQEVRYPKHNGHLRVRGSDNFIIRNFNIEGTNLGRDHQFGSAILDANGTSRNIECLSVHPSPELDKSGERAKFGCYTVAMEFDHGFALHGNNNLVLENSSVDGVWGDGVYVSGGDQFASSDLQGPITIRRVRIDRNGRQGMAIVRNSNVLIDRAAILHSRRSGIDLEPDSSSELISNIEIRDTAIRSTLLPFASGGPGNVSNVYVHHNEVLRGGVPWVHVRSNNCAVRRQNWRIEDNRLQYTLSSPAPGIRLCNVGDVEIHRNQAFSATHIESTSVGLATDSSANITCNWFRGAKHIASADNTSTYTVNNNSTDDVPPDCLGTPGVRPDPKKTDHQAPTAPASLQVTGISNESVALSWDASTDDVAVTHYEIYRGEMRVATIPASQLTYTDRKLGITADTTYTYTVTALDAHFNRSGLSNTVSAQTIQITDHEPTPTKPGDVNGDNKVDISDLSILLTNWNSTTFPSADLNQDGIVNISDLSILLSNWGK